MDPCPHQKGKPLPLRLVSISCRHLTMRHTTLQGQASTTSSTSSSSTSSSMSKNKPKNKDKPKKDNNKESGAAR